MSGSPTICVFCPISTMTYQASTIHDIFKSVINIYQLKLAQELKNSQPNPEPPSPNLHGEGSPGLTLMSIPETQIQQSFTYL